MWLLHFRNGDARAGAAAHKAKSDRQRNPQLHAAQSLPLRHAYRHHARDQARRHRLGRFAMNAPLPLSRRDLLKGSSVLVVAFSLAPHMDALAQDAAAATKPVSLDQVDSFLAIDDKGMVTLYAGKVDLGTGVNIGLAQIVAEELDVRLADFQLGAGASALTPDQGPTYGSQSI